MSEISDVEERMRENAEQDVEREGLFEGSRVNSEGWFEARAIEEDELVELFTNKAIPMLLGLIGGAPPSNLLCAMAVYGFTMGFEVAANRYAKDAPAGITMQPFTGEEMRLIQRAVLAIEDGGAFTEEEQRKLNNIRLVCQGQVDDR